MSGERLTGKRRDSWHVVRTIAILTARIEAMEDGDYPDAPEVIFERNMYESAVTLLVEVRNELDAEILEDRDGDELGAIFGPAPNLVAVDQMPADENAWSDDPMAEDLERLIERGAI